MVYFIGQLIILLVAERLNVLLLNCSNFKLLVFGIVLLRQQFLFVEVG